MMQVDENREDELDAADEADWEMREALEDPEGPQECDLLNQPDDDETDTVPCPKCGRDIVEDADQCPYCGEWVIQGGADAASSHGVVFMLVAVLVLVVLAYWLLG
jgi:uncharacterized paraquat-inducible protein A